MPNLNALRLEVSTTLIVAARKWRRTSHSMLAVYNVSEACAAPLLIAGRLGEGVNQVTLAEHVGIEGPSLVRLLDQLCTAGLVRRDEDPGDRRAKTISLTEEGRAITAEVEKQLIDLRDEVLHDVSRADLEATLRVLKAFRASKGATRGPVRSTPG
jgi:MarR family transcriptional regulator for hemolysin